MSLFIMEVNGIKLVRDVCQHKWYQIDDFAVIVGYQMKLAGINWKGVDDLAHILVELVEVGFTEVHPEDHLQVRIKEHWFNA